MKEKLKEKMETCLELMHQATGDWETVRELLNDPVKIVALSGQLKYLAAAAYVYHCVLKNDIKSTNIQKIRGQEVVLVNLKKLSKLQGAGSRKPVQERL